MNFSLTSGQEILRTTAREFLSEECPTSLVRSAEESGDGHVAELWQNMARLGWLGIAMPERYGGAGRSLTDQAVLFEELGRALVPGPMITSSVLSAHIVLYGGTEQQKQNLLPGMIQGNLILTLARGERLETSSQSGGLILGGESSFVRHAGIANHIICATRPAIGAWPDTTLVLVDSQTDGVIMTAMESIANYPQYTVEFDDISLSNTAVLGGIAEGRVALEMAIQQATVVQCAETIGRCQKVLEMVVEYASSGGRFGRGSQSVQHRCADLKMALEGGRLLTYQAASRLDQGSPASEAIAMAKAQSGTLSRLATETGHSIFGAASFTVEHDMQLYSARAKIAEANLGDTEYHLDQMISG